MALDPGAKVRSRMLVAVFIRLAERMVQLEGRSQRSKSHQRQNQKQRQDEMTRFHLAYEVATMSITDLWNGQVMV